jgi:hypothetical protein
LYFQFEHVKEKAKEMFIVHINTPEKLYFQFVNVNVKAMEMFINTEEYSIFSLKM